MREGSAKAMFTDFPPPYRLTGDFALFWVLVDSAALERLSGAPAIGALGRSVLTVVLARYREVRYGPERRRWRPEAEGDAYRELSLAHLSGLVPPFTLGFPRLWVDSLEETPIALGGAYGFPKTPGTICWEDAEASLDVAIDDEHGPVMRVRAKLRLPLPAGPLTWFSGARASFPATGLQAPVRLRGEGRGALLAVQRWEAPRLERWGLGGQPRFGLWLPGAELALGAPEAALRA